MSETVQPSDEALLASTIPSEPESIPPDTSWEHFELYERVYKSLFALPSFFKSDLVISGVLATDLFTFNSSLGATIEAQVTDALNALRSSWDPEEKYTLYRFVRQSQTFPDVTLRTSAPGVSPAVLMGIELKGWYILAKEREPSFRYRVSPQVCAPADLLVIYPWALSQVISGSPQLFQPYVISARYAAEYRNWWWQYRKAGRGNNHITPSIVTDHYPVKSDRISDTPVSDNGGNFGRFARTGKMDTYMASSFSEELAGIPLDAWQKFLAIFTESHSQDKLSRTFDSLSSGYSMRRETLSSEAMAKVRDHLIAIADLLQTE